ncbi:MAG: ABC transporter ATP-binding protein [Erysipelothrix sp.]|nr:ABC transporter ATP-binding protein [Erysipelothrix sp.]
MSKNTNHVLEVKNLSIAFGGLKAVDDLSFEIKEREIFGLIGPNGAGKTTVFNCITQFYKPDNGEIYFTNNKNERTNLVGQQVHKIIDQGLVRTFQNVELINELTILENVLIGAHISFTSGLLAQAFNTKKAQLEEAELREKAMRILTSLEIDHLADAYAGGLPYGISKKVELARAVISDPKLIILDEPAAGLNDVETMQLVEMIRKIRDDLGCSILLVEHDMRLVMEVSDTVCAINFGKHLATGSPKEIQQNKAVQEAYLGTKEEEDE